MKKILAAITIAATLIGSGASAFEEENLRKLKETNKCQECDLSGADVSSAALRGAELNAANLTGANLDGADLTGANLSGARMKGAILCNTIMPNGGVIYSGC